MKRPGTNTFLTTSITEELEMTSPNETSDR